MAKDVAGQIVAARELRHFDTMIETHKQTGVSVKALERLAAADGFRSMGLDRRQALWEVRSLMDAPDLPLFEHAKAKDVGADPAVILPLMPLSEHVVADYQTLRLSLKAHPLSFLRDRYKQKGIISCADLWNTKDGARVKIAGAVLIRQRPGTAKGIVFITLEDETGVANAVVWQNVMKTHRKVIMTSRLLMISGRIQRTGDIIHVIAKGLEDYSGDLELLSQGQFYSSNEMSHHPRNKRIIPKSRDFH
jgi:error-prone DNA polymerase